MLHRLVINANLEFTVDDKNSHLNSASLEDPSMRHGVSRRLADSLNVGEYGEGGFQLTSAAVIGTSYEPSP